MPLRNLMIIGLATVISLSCYSISTKNRFASIFGEAMNIVQKEALKKKSRRELFDAAMTGMLSELDENSTYISSTQYKSFAEDLNQEFFGVGMTVERDEEADCIRVLSPMPGTPAYRAGMKIGDRIVKIDDHSTAGVTSRDAIKLIRGPRGAPVVFTILREGEEGELKISIVRDSIPVPSVYGDTRNDDGTWNFTLEDDPRIGYIRLVEFGKRSTEEMQTTIRSIKEDIDALILDLRGNPGGLLDAAVEISDMFIGREVLVVETRNREQKVVRRRYATSKTELDTRVPIVVIVNEYSASASEIVSACLQDHKRGVVVGWQTFGKGTVQDLITLEYNRSVLRLTTASYWRPSGENIDRTVEPPVPADAYGVKPDEGYAVPLTDEELLDITFARRDRDQAVLTDKNKPLQPDKPDWIEVDKPLKRAVEHLRDKLPAKRTAA